MLDAQGLGLSPESNKPLVAVVSRLVPQKGIHLIKAAIYRTVQQGGQFVLLGSGHADGIFKQMMTTDFKDHPDCKSVTTSFPCLQSIMLLAGFITFP